jgi:hypothetical protein
LQESDFGHLLADKNQLVQLTKTLWPGKHPGRIGFVGSTYVCRCRPLQAKLALLLAWDSAGTPDLYNN